MQLKVLYNKRNYMHQVLHMKKRQMKNEHKNMKLYINVYSIYFI